MFFSRAFRGGIERWTLFFLLVLVPSCADKVDTPFGTQVRTRIRDHNQRTIDSLPKSLPSSSLKIGLVADSHGDTKDLASILNRLDKESVDFIIHLGDFTNSAYASEFDAFLTVMNKSRVPYLVVIGNHDSLGAGPFLFRMIFGEYNFSFSFKGRRIVLFNANTIEFAKNGGVDLDWLRHQVETSQEPTYIFQHIDPVRVSYFPIEQRTQYETSVTSGNRARMIFTGHTHNFSRFYANGVRGYTIAQTSGERFAILEIDDSVDTVHFCAGESCQRETLAR